MAAASSFSEAGRAGLCPHLNALLLCRVLLIRIWRLCHCLWRVFREFVLFRWFLNRQSQFGINDFNIVLRTHFTRYAQCFRLRNTRQHDQWHRFPGYWPGIYYLNLHLLTRQPPGPRYQRFHCGGNDLLRVNDFCQLVES